MSKNVITGIRTPFIKELNLPQVGDEAANKDYVDQEISSALSQITINGIAFYDGGDFSGNNGIFDGGNFV